MDCGSGNGGESGLLPTDMRAHTHSNTHTPTHTHIPAPGCLKSLETPAAVSGWKDVFFFSVMRNRFDPR